MGAVVGKVGAVVSKVVGAVVGWVVGKVVGNAVGNVVGAEVPAEGEDAPAGCDCVGAHPNRGSKSVRVSSKMKVFLTITVPAFLICSAQWHDVF